MLKKRRNKDDKKNAPQSTLTPKQSAFKRLYRKYENTLIQLRDEDIPDTVDITKFCDFCNLYSAILELREKRAIAFKNKGNLQLLTDQPLPQNKRQLYMARSLIKKYREEYVASEQAIEVIPLINNNICYAGKEKNEATKQARTSLELIVDKGALSINQHFSIDTNLEAGMKCDVDDITFASWYTTLTSNVVTGEKSGEAIAVEITTDRHGNVSYIPAPQT